MTTLGGVQIAEIDNAAEREVSDLLGRTNTVSFQVPSSGRWTSQLATTNVLIRAWFGSQLRFNGRVIGYNRVANSDGRSLAILAADPSWVFPLRRVGKNGGAGRVTTSLLDLGLVAKTILDEANADSDMHLRTGQQPYLSGSIGSYISGAFKPLSEVVADLATGVGGFDWTVKPMIWTDGKWGDWSAVPIMGTRRDDVLFGYIEGGGGNMATITDSVSKTTQATRVYHYTELGAGAAGVPVVTSTPVSEATTDGLYEDVADAQLYELPLRTALVNAHVDVRKHPRRVITFEPQAYDPLSPGNVPVFGVDYDLGDIVRARAEDEWGVWFDGWFRVHGWTARPSNEGLESGTLSLVDEGEGMAGVN